MEEWIDCPECQGWTSTETGMDCPICGGDGAIHNPDFGSDADDEIEKQ